MKAAKNAKKKVSVQKLGTARAAKDCIEIKHDKFGLKIYITIVNNNNLANEGGNAGLKQKAQTGGQIVAGKNGKNANQGGQIAGKCGQNANQNGRVKSKNCGKKVQ